MWDSKLLKRQYTEEFRTEVIRPAASVGWHEACRLGIPVSNLGNGLRRRRSAGALTFESTVAMRARRPVSELETENSRLRRELADAKLDVEILRKETACFAKSVAMKCVRIENSRDTCTVSRLCRVLSVSRRCTASGACEGPARER